MIHRDYLDLYYEHYGEHQATGANKGRHLKPYAVHFRSIEERDAYEDELIELGYEKVFSSRSNLMLINPEFKRYGYHTKAVNFGKRNNTIYTLEEYKNL